MKLNYTQNVPLTIGLDQIRIDAKIIKIDERNFLKAIKENNDQVECIEAKIGQECLEIFKDFSEKNHFKYVSIDLTRAKLVLGERKGVRNKSVLYVYVLAPDKRHYLGNINNVSVSQAQARVKEIYKELADNYGIFVKDEAEMQNTELNINIVLNEYGYNFDDAVRILCPFQMELPKFDHCFYLDSGNKEEKIPIQKKSLILNHQINQIRSLQSKSSKGRLLIKLYNKAYQLEKKNYNKLLVEDVLRIEFTFNESRTIHSYFSSTDLFKLTQTDIEETFCSVLNQFILRNIELYHSTELENMKSLANLMDNKSVDWISSLGNTIRQACGSNGFSCSNITTNDLKEILYVHLNSSRANKKRTYKKVLDKFQKEYKDILRITDQMQYEELINDIKRNYGKTQEVNYIRRYGTVA